MIRSSIVATGALVAWMALSGCGGDDDDPQRASTASTPRQTPSTTTTTSSQPAPAGCASPTAKPGDNGDAKVVAAGTKFVADLLPRSGDAGRVELTVREATVARNVPGSRRLRKALHPPAGYRFVVVKIALENTERAEIEAASSIGNVAWLSSPAGRKWERVDRATGCAKVSPAFARAGRGLASPELNAAKGSGYTTVLAYAVPANASSLSWSVPGYRVPLDIPSED